MDTEKSKYDSCWNIVVFLFRFCVRDLSSFGECIFLVLYRLFISPAVIRFFSSQNKVRDLSQICAQWWKLGVLSVTSKHYGNKHHTKMMERARVKSTSDTANSIFLSSSSPFFLNLRRLGPLNWTLFSFSFFLSILFMPRQQWGVESTCVTSGSLF